MDNNKPIIKSLKILGIETGDYIYDNYINNQHKKYYYKVLNSNLSKDEKNNLLIEINNAKEILDKFNCDELMQFILENQKNINEDKLITNKYKINPNNKEEFKNHRNSNSKNEYINKPRKIKRKKKNKPIFISCLEFCLGIFYYILILPLGGWYLFIYFLDAFTPLDFLVYLQSIIEPLDMIFSIFFISVIILFLVKLIFKYD